MLRRLRCVLLVSLLLHPSLLRAHQSTNSYVLVTIANGELTLAWDVAVADLAHVVALQTNAADVIAASELEAKQNLVLQYALSRFQVRADGESCPLELASDKLTHLEKPGYARVELVCRWPTNAARLELACRALFETDPSHHSLLRLDWKGQTRTGVFTADTMVQTFGGATSLSRQFLVFLHEGVRHIWTGFDHILFLLALLLPAVIRRDQRGWHPVDTFDFAFVHIVKVVTAFTIAHSITLTLSVLGVVHPPPRLIESTIAVSVLIAAVNNLRPVLKGNAWMLAFGFGLIHGFGFANALAELDLPRAGLALTLLGFNLGVELGQLAIVSVFLPFAFGLRASWFYRKLVLQGGSVLVSLVAVIWIVERVFDVKVLRF